MKVTICLKNVPGKNVELAWAHATRLADGYHAIADKGCGKIRTCRGNTLTVTDTTISYSGRRHALFDKNNVVGSFLSGLCGNSDYWGQNALENDEQMELYEFKVLKFETTTPEREWYQEY